MRSATMSGSPLWNHRYRNGKLVSLWKSSPFFSCARLRDLAFPRFSRSRHNLNLLVKMTDFVVYEDTPLAEYLSCKSLGVQYSLLYFSPFWCGRSESLSTFKAFDGADSAVKLPPLQTHTDGSFLSRMSRHSSSNEASYSLRRILLHCWQRSLLHASIP